MSLGQGSKSVVGMATEASYGTTEYPPTQFPIITAESITAPRELIKSGALTGNRMTRSVVPGISTIGGGLEMEMDGLQAGYPVWLWNGDAGYTQAQATGVITAAPTGVASGAANTLAAGTYFYRVAAMLQWNGGSTAWIFIREASAASAGIVVGAGELVTLSYTNPAGLTLPQGFTYYGTAIYRTMTGGLVGTTKWLDIQVGSGASYVDDGSVNTGATAASTVDPITTVAIHRHEFLGTTPGSGVEALSPFTVSINKDNDFCEVYTGCRMGEMTISAGSQNEPVKASFTLIGKSVSLDANFTPTIVPIDAMLGWQAAISINGAAADCNVRSFEVKGTNNLEAVPGLCSTPFNQDVASGFREVTWTLNRGFVDHDLWSLVMAGTEFTLRISAWGQPCVVSGCTLNLADHGVDAKPFPYFMEIDLFRCKGGSADGNISGPSQIVQGINGQCIESVTYGSEMRIYLYNTESTDYA